MCGYVLCFYASPIVNVHLLCVLIHHPNLFLMCGIEKHKTQHQANFKMFITSIKTDYFPITNSFLKSLQYFLTKIICDRSSLVALGVDSWTGDRVLRGD